MEDICACLKEMNVSHKLLYFLVKFLNVYTLTAWGLEQSGIFNLWFIMEEFLWFYFLVVYVLRWPMQLTGFKIPRTNQLYNLFKITILPAFLALFFFFPSKPVFWQPSWTVQPCCTELPCSDWCWEDQASNASFPVVCGCRPRGACWRLPKCWGGCLGPVAP